MAYSVDTIIWFRVSVPVLSVLIALVAPRVSTSERFFTTALASASCFAPIDSSPDTKAGSPVGMAEIAIAVPSRSSSWAGMPRISPTTMITADRAPGDQAEHLGEGVELLLQRRPGPCDRGQHGGDLTHLGLHPGRGHHHRPGSPGHRGVLEQHVGLVAEADVDSSRGRRASLGIGALSPVSAASCVSSVAERRIRPSAGMMSPASTLTTSPGTISVAAISPHLPVADDPGLGHLQLGQRVDAGSGLELLPRVPRTMLSTISSATITTGRDLADHDADQRHRDQHEVHRIAQLPQRHRHDRRRLLRRDLVRRRTSTAAAATSASVSPRSASDPRSVSTASADRA